MKKVLMTAMVAAMALSVQAFGANLIINGDFEAGNTGFNTEYGYVAPPVSPPSTVLGAPAKYTVHTNPHDVHTAWTPYGDRTSGTGNMLIVNAACDDGGDAATPTIFTIWEQTVPVTPGKDYLLSYWLASSYATNRANIECSITGNVSGTTVLGTQLAPAATGEWIPVPYIWNAGDNASATISLQDLTRKYSGDDFAIDDISLVSASDSATGYGTRILSKGTWFMYNEYPEGPYDIQAGNPNDGVNIIGSYDITDNGNGTYTATYDIDDTIVINGVEYDIVVTDEHLAVSDTMNFTAKPGRDDNADFGVPFEADGAFFIFAHFEVEYQ